MRSALIQDISDLFHHNDEWKIKRIPFIYFVPSVLWLNWTQHSLKSWYTNDTIIIYRKCITITGETVELPHFMGLLGHATTRKDFFDYQVSE